MSLHQSDLEALESSNEICQSKHTNLKSKPPQNQRNNKDKQENKELNEKSRHTKEYLRKSTRVDEENKNLATGNFFF